MLAVPAQLEKQAAHVGVRADEHDQDGIGVEDFDDGEAGVVFKHGGHESAAMYGVAQLVCGADNGGNARGQIFWVQAGYTLTIDQEPITTEHDRSFHTVPVSNCSYEVSNTRHAHSTGESAAKLKGEVSEVKLRYSLEFARRPAYSQSAPLRISFSRHLMLPTRFLRVAIVAIAIVSVACGDLTRPKATYANALSSYSMYGLTTAPATGANALSFLGGAVHANSSFLFDIAFDIDATGRTIIYPVRTLAGAAVGVPKRVGLQTVTGTFDALRAVPQTGYDTVSVKTVSPGTVVAVELRDATSCFSYSLISSQFLYAKLVVDSVDQTAKRIYLRTVVDPNCGYFSVVPDSVPTQ